jgi:hypothetical protein
MVSTPRLRLLSAVLVLFVVALVPSGLNADHEWGYHWKKTTAGPVVLTVGDNVSGTWDGHLMQAVSDWNASAVLDLTVLDGSVSPRSCKPKSGKIEVCSAAYGYNGWLGLARIWVSGVHITAGSTQVNDTYFDTSSYDTPEWRQFVMCQEIGHDFGLSHTNEDFDNYNEGTCMDYTDNPAGGSGEPANTAPNDHDFDVLENIYSHIDSSSSGGGGGPGRGRGNGARVGLNLDPQDAPAFVPQSDWGELVRANRRSALYRLNLGNGNYVFTFVIRA